MKNIGIILIILASAAAGAKAADGLAARCRVLRQTERFIEKAAMMIRCTASPLEDIISSAASDSSLFCLTFLSDIETALDSGEINIRALWHTSLKKAPPEHIRSEELAVLEELGDILGSTDVQGQTDSLSLMKAYIISLIENAETERKERGKLYRCLGITGGLFIAVILI